MPLHWWELCVCVCVCVCVCARVRTGAHVHACSLISLEFQNVCQGGHGRVDFSQWTAQIEMCRFRQDILCLITLVLPSLKWE